MSRAGKPTFKEIVMRSKYILTFGLVFTCGLAHAAMTQVDTSRPESVPVSLMAQFYAVDSSDVKVDSIDMNDRGDEATVATSAAGGHHCTMGVAKATLSDGKLGWAVSSIGCRDK
jgi:hypothetical protein